MNPLSLIPSAPRDWRACLKQALAAHLALLPLLLPATARSAEVRFNRDIRPILSDNCLACHGPDAGARKAGLRLDTKQGLYEATEKREPALVPGSLDKSVLWARINHTDPDEVMPPPDSNKVLKPEQKELLKQWILAGAAWEGHWAFVKPERPAPPSVSDAAWVRNPIDAFLLERLEARSLKPAAEADRRTLARRLSLDLTGLPPSPDVIEAFVLDESPDAYERLVQQFLNSPHWGEHRARYWLDAARYADTHGLHFDNYREMWPYRDWVIEAFNRNQPFDQFTIEQIAGDLLENPSDEQLVATGFHRCNMTTNEGGTIEAENLANYANDRVTTTGWVWLGLTMNCSACHDHKFDPITTRDFYSMSAFFRNTKQSGFDRNTREGDLSMLVPQGESDRARWKALPGEIGTARKTLESAEKEIDGAFTNWLGYINPAALASSVDFPDELVRFPLNEGAGTGVSGRIDGAVSKLVTPDKLEWRMDGPLGPAPIMTKDHAITVGDAGNFDSKSPFSLGAWVHLPEDFKGEGSVLAKMGGEEDKYRGWDLFVRDDEFGMHMIRRWSPVAMKVTSSGKAVKKGVWQHLFVTYDGSGRAEGLRLFVNGAEVKVSRNQNSLEGSILNNFPMRIGRREKSNQLNGVAVQDVRLYQRRLLESEIGALGAAPRLSALLAEAKASETNAVPRIALRDYFRATQHTGWQNTAADLARLETERDVIRGRSPVTHIQREKPASEPVAHILFRGQYDKPKDKVTAATPTFLPPMPAGAPTNRLGLARWIVSRENPLTARVIVNRFWQDLFGTGLVKSSEDFGVMGESPVNQALLDWLAVEFQESGWDVKHLFRLIVTSSAYRQSPEITPEKLEKDPQNRYLSRGPRFRMDAEMIRDYAFAASGMLAKRVGGPSVRPPQPGGVWEAVAMPESNTRFYERDRGEALYRRSLYTFWKRAAPPALMDVLNAPSREVCAVRRERTNTPLQALATLNDPQFVEAARNLAESALSHSNGDPVKAAEHVALALLGRPLAAEESAIVKQTLADMAAFYEKEPESARQLLSHAEKTPAGNLPAAQLAALTMVANQLMNLDEVLNK